jgi:hypothetical protein
MDDTHGIGCDCLRWHAPSYRARVSSSSPPQVEDAKRCLFLYGNQTSQVVKDVVTDLYQLKRVRARGLWRECTAVPGLRHRSHARPLNLHRLPAPLAVRGAALHTQERKRAAV